MNPTLRKPFGVLAIVLGLTLYAVLIASAANLMAALPLLVQASIYLVLGIVWILPLRPLLIWMETGSFRAPRG